MTPVTGMARLMGSPGSLRRTVGYPTENDQSSKDTTHGNHTEAVFSLHCCGFRNCLYNPTTCLERATRYRMARAPA
jgi:hypothetical protein